MTVAGIAENGTAQSPSKVSVLYIGGAGRSGSTVLDLMLGELPGFFAACEIGPVGGESFLHGFTATVAVFAS